MDYKKCPYCGEAIASEAQKCRYYGKWLADSPDIDAVKAGTKTVDNIDAIMRDSSDEKRKPEAEKEGIESFREIASSVKTREGLFKELNEQRRLLQSVTAKLDQTQNTLRVDFDNHAPEPHVYSWEFPKSVMEWFIVVLIIMFLVHVVCYLFWKSLWGTLVSVFHWGVGITIGTYVLCGIVNVLLDNVEKNRKKQYDDLLETQKIQQKEKNGLEQKVEHLEYIIKESFKKDFADIVEIPVSTENVSLSKADEMNKLIRDFCSLKQRTLSNASLPDMLSAKEIVANERLKLFYNWAVKGEAPNTFPSFYKLYSKAEYHKDWNLLRIEPQDKKAFSYLSDMNYYETLLNDNRMEGILSRFDEAANRDVTGYFGWFRNVSDMAQQTKDMHELFNAAKLEYEELEELSDKMNYLLEFVRVCAFRNIFLGIELIGLIKDVLGGKSLTTQKDYTEMKADVRHMQVNATDLNINFSSSNFDATSKALNDALGLMENKRFRKQMFDDPRTAGAWIGGVAAMTVIEGAIGYINERNQKIENNAQKQKELVRNFKKVIDGYRVGQEGLLRSIELVKAITKANEGFMAIYDPLRKSVFEDRRVDTITSKDIASLSIALNSYNSISKTKL